MRGAVKLLLPQHAANASLKTRFLREGYLANKVVHPGVVRVLDDDTTEDGGAFLVMELLEGESLVERAARWGGALPAREVMAIAAEVLDVLAAAHDVGVVHRDIKPENLFVTRDGMVKVLDFGLARAFEGDGMMASVTQTGFAMGTPAYMSPEQARGRWNLVDEQSDVWSMGATMFALASGQHVHEEETLTELVAAIFMKPARSLASVSLNAPPQLVEIVDRALALKKSDRWGSAREMRDAIVHAYEELWGPLSVVQPPAPSGIAFDAPESGLRSVDLAFTRSRPRSSGPPQLSLSDRPTISAPITPSTAPARSRRVLFVAAAGCALAATIAAGLALRPRTQAVAVPPPPDALLSSTANATSTSTATQTANATPTSTSTSTSTPTPTGTSTAISDATPAVVATPTPAVSARPAPPPPSPLPPRASAARPPAPPPARTGSMFDRRY
jgi:serine/threonine-protein kinase